MSNTRALNAPSSSLFLVDLLCSCLEELLGQTHAAGGAVLALTEVHLLHQCNLAVVFILSDGGDSMKGGHKEGC